MPLPDHYATLGLKPTATFHEIKQTYRLLVRRHHPDRHGGDARAEQRMAAINAAYEVLHRPERRMEYDRHFYEAFPHRIESAESTRQAYRDANPYIDALWRERERRMQRERGNLGGRITLYVLLLAVALYAVAFGLWSALQPPAEAGRSEATVQPVR
ncbi:MAG TPA: J domain-containing protein [Candidatus Sumerlaeota bacterium]|nr:MAG: Chaperone protein DnaJ [candidate division BRC1 bacterium ADurb.BinA292]HOE95086.1 J domain-containing protein [Candidatus Sumerlaeota bacterium]HOR26415.1 J domain-containing protein [Candidatus Sumerlaeota bacterium]HPK01885.1 J domain-containing protein [Candidatus Sumerlaeota bacterium]